LEVVLPDGRVWNGLRALRKDNTGYNLKDLFVGAEGTLGIITAAVLELQPPVRQKSTFFAAVPSVQSAVNLLSRVRADTGDAVYAFELMPRFGLELTLRHVEGARDPLGESSPWYVLCDVLVPETALEPWLADWLEERLLTDATIAQTAAQSESLWRLRESLSEAQKPEGGSIKHDVSVPVSKIPDMVDTTIRAVADYMPGIRPVPFGHVGDGNLHFNLTQPKGMDKAEYLSHWEPINRIVHDIVTSLSGSISAEHGIGIAKRDDLVRYKDPVELDMMRALKRAFDPVGIMNPGKLL
jgi:FAD/FMN-containing dehydrogenase